MGADKKRVLKIVVVYLKFSFDQCFSCYQLSKKAPKYLSSARKFSISGN